MKSVLVLCQVLFTVSLFAGIKEEAIRMVPKGWDVDNQEMVVADFNADTRDDIALIYYRVDPELGEYANRINRVLVMLSEEEGLVRLVDQEFPYEEDFGTEVQLDWRDEVLHIFQHMGVMHRFNDWGLEWDTEEQKFWERTYASGGIMGLGSATSFDAKTGIGHVEKIWDDVDVSADYSTIYAERPKGTIKVDGRDDEMDWQLARSSDVSWVTWGEGDWKGESDASFEVRALYDDEVLYLSVKVCDDCYVQPSNANRILEGDHLELWIDRLTYDVAAETPDPPSEMWDRVKDPFVTQIAVAETPEGEPAIKVWLPEGSDYESDVKAGFSYTDNVWSVEVEIPWAQFCSQFPLEYVSFTLTFSDSDDETNPEQETIIATSQLRWADPFTFGSLITEIPERVYWGIRPILKEEQ